MFNIYNIILLFTAHMLCVVPSIALAQNNLWATFEKIKKANEGNIINYSYRVYIVNKNTGLSEDSIKGHFFKDRYSYLDSNDTQLTAFDGLVYCKLDFKQQEATIYDASYLKEKLGLSIDSNVGSVITIPDSVILKYGNVKFDFPKERNVFIAQISLTEKMYSNITVELNKSSYEVLRMEIETDLNERLHGDDYKKIYIIEKIKRQIDREIINLNRFVKVNDNKVELRGKYAKYKLISLTN